jgi:hypothetical protein
MKFVSPSTLKVDTVKRKFYHFTPDEVDKFNDIVWQQCRGQFKGDAFAFWREAAANRGIDYRTIISKPDRSYEFTALPMGHNRHWCHPMSLKCRNAPPKFIEGVS